MIGQEVQNQQNYETPNAYFADSVISTYCYNCQLTSTTRKSIEEFSSVSTRKKSLCQALSQDFFRNYDRAQFVVDAANCLAMKGPILLADEVARALCLCNAPRSYAPLLTGTDGNCTISRKFSEVASLPNSTLKIALITNLHLILTSKPAIPNRHILHMCNLITRGGRE